MKNLSGDPGLDLKFGTKWHLNLQFTVEELIDNDDLVFLD